METYIIIVKDGELSVEREFKGVPEYLDVAIEREFRNKKYREELVRKFLIGYADIYVTDSKGEVVASGRFETNIFSGLSNYAIKLS